MCRKAGFKHVKKKKLIFMPEMLVVSIYMPAMTSVEALSMLSFHTGLMASAATLISHSNVLSDSYICAADRRMHRNGSFM